MEKKVKDRIDKTMNSVLLQAAYSDIHELFKDAKLKFFVRQGYTVTDNETDEVCHYEITVIKLPKPTNQ